MKRDEAIDRLYQLPLKEFTPARNALAKEIGGADAAAIRSLQKPNAAAWAVNQLYWRERETYDRLVSAAERLRQAHRSLLAGKAVDLHDAETVHRDAIREATQKIREILRASGESATQATLAAVAETLEALPSDEEPPGRLTRPLKRMGFEALAGVAPRAGGAPARTLSLVSSREKKPPPKPAMPPARQREIEELETRLRTAQIGERQLQEEMERGRREVERAERELARVQQELEDVTEKVKRLRAELASKEKAQKANEAEQKKLEDRLANLRGERG